MKGKQRTIWFDEDEMAVEIIDQRELPHNFSVIALKSTNDVADAIRDMAVRGAPLIGATAACGIYLAGLEALTSDNFDGHLQHSAKQLSLTRPTAINLQWALDRQLNEISGLDNRHKMVAVLLKTAKDIIEEDVVTCSMIGDFGVTLIEEIFEKKGGDIVNILTHCNAGWLACIEWGTATAPIYKAHLKGIPVHVWVDETRPRNQGAALTAWELAEAGVPHTVITDNAGGHLMQKGMVDMVITGTDRTTYKGDVCNKVGTYLKALAAFDNTVPFYVALPASTIDWETADGHEIKIEERNMDEVKYAEGLYENRKVKILLTPKDSNALNVSFDVTPARLITGLITERGICEANENAIAALFPEKIRIK